MTDTVAPIELVTRSGITLAVRHATVADEALLSAFFDQVSAEDRRFRFLCAADHVSRGQLAPLLDGDPRGSASFLAFDKANGELVASALLVCDEDFDTGEIAVSIRHDYRGKGVGWALLDMLGGEAAERGVRRVISIESRENHAAIELERERGFSAESVDGDPMVVLLSKTFA